MEEQKLFNLEQAFIRFKNKMSDIKKRQLFLFENVDKRVVEEKAQKIREKINHQ